MTTLALRKQRELRIQKGPGSVPTKRVEDDDLYRKGQNHASHHTTSSQRFYLYCFRVRPLPSRSSAITLKFARPSPLTLHREQDMCGHYWIDRRCKLCGHLTVHYMYCDEPCPEGKIKGFMQCGKPKDTYTKTESWRCDTCGPAVGTVVADRQRMAQGKK